VTVPSTGGLADVQARVAHLQARIASVSAPAVRAARPELATQAAGGFADVLAAAPAVAAGQAQPVTAGGALRVAGAASVAGGVVDQAAASAPATAGPGTWADRLPVTGQRWAGAIEQAARDAGIDPALLAALVRHESNFDPDVRSHAGAIGLAQLMPGTAAALGVDPTDPVQNLRGGARYLREQLDRFGTPELALAAYNAGPNRVAQAGGIPRITETQTYVRRVLDTWEQLR
jgi:soluble lytic murein transglycosylase-like protein